MRVPGEMQIFSDEAYKLAMVAAQAWTRATPVAVDVAAIVEAALELVHACDTALEITQNELNKR